MAQGRDSAVAVKRNFSFEPRVAELLSRRAQEQGKSASRYLAELVEHDARSAQDQLAAAGYREMAVEAHAFAEAALPLAAESWPAWEEIK